MRTQHPGRHRVGEQVVQTQFPLLRLRKTLLLRLPKEVDDPVPRYPKQPPRYVFNRDHHPICFHERMEHVLQDVLDIASIRNPLTNEVA